MNPAQTIAETLDRNLTRPTEVVVFGAAALLLDRKFARRMGGRTTNDIDIIIPAERELKLNTDREFWQALEATNRELEPNGLYITHIFPEREVALTPEWKQHTVPLYQEYLSKLTLVRPRVLDLVISKMGRGDAQDVADVRSMLRLHRDVTGVEITGAQIAEAAKRANVPAVYREIFPRACERIVAAARELESGPDIRPGPAMRPPPNSPRSGPRMGL
jgi:hypothetical protein